MQATLWVVYRAPVRGKTEGTNVVCEQTEWDALERADPGRYQLVREGIANEGEAERLARGAAGDPVRRRTRETPVAQLLADPEPAGTVAVP